MSNIVDKRMLIIEDNVLVGDMIAVIIADAGGIPFGPVLTEFEALLLINYDPAMSDAAIIDIGVDAQSFRLAARLRELGIPFMFATGSPQDIPISYRDIPVCAKPFTDRDLLAALSAMMRPPFGSPSSI